MNRQQRRHMERHKTRQAGMLEFHRRTKKGGFGGPGGAIQAFIWRLPHLATERGMMMMAQFGATILEQADQPPLCLTCEYAFTIRGTPPGALAITLPISEDANLTAVVTGVCDDCCARHGDEQLLEVVFQGLHKIGLAKAKFGPPTRADN
jgi:hypothetical protein